MPVVPKLLLLFLLFSLPIVVVVLGVVVVVVEGRWQIEMAIGCLFSGAG